MLSKKNSSRISNFILHILQNIQVYIKEVNIIKQIAYKNTYISYIINRILTKQWNKALTKYCSSLKRTKEIKSYKQYLAINYLGDVSYKIKRLLLHHI